MSIKAYTGRMGSGKTYEVVSVVILGALARGRRVITNIAGINYQAMADLLVADGVDADKVGTIVQIPHERVTSPEFWLTETGNEAVKAKLASGEIDQTVQSILPGDLVALDEIWRFWQGFATKDADNKKRPDAVMNFYRMHRHFTHSETGTACDVALITQDVMDISRQVRAVIEETYRMEKLTAIGSTKRYRVDVCQGGQTRRVLRDIQRSYDPKYFGLYQSHSGRKEGDAQAVEENIDQRGNILKGALFKFVLPVGLVVFIIAVMTVKNFFNPKDASKPETAKADQKKVSPAKRARETEETDKWRVVGWIGFDPMRVVVSDGQRMRIIQPPNWKMTGLTIETFMPNGEAVTPWSGPTHQSGIIDKAAGQ